MTRLVIMGAGGHGRVLADNALKNGYTEICFVDDYSTGEMTGFPIIGKCADVEALNDGKTDFVIGIGNNAVRKKLSETYHVNWVPLVHPSAQIAFNAGIGKGTVVMANAVVNACAAVGEHAIINSGAVVEHDNKIGDFVHISPNAALGGTVQVGELTHIGIGAAVKNNINICAGCILGAGTVVVKDITEPGTYLGVPARKK